MAVQFISSNVEPSIADPILKLDRHDGEEIFVNKNKFVAEVKEKKKKFLMR